MKIYLFCPETGLYQGEDFADCRPVPGGQHAMPTGATIIAPPAYQRGETPVFLRTEQRWVVRSLVRLQDWPIKPAPAHVAASIGSEAPLLEHQASLLENQPTEGTP